MKTTLWQHLNLKLGGRYDFINVNVPDYDVLRNKLSDPQVQVKGGKLKYNNMSFNVGSIFKCCKHSFAFCFNGITLFKF